MAEPYATAEDYATALGKTWPVAEWDDAEVARINAGLVDAQVDIDDATYFSRYDPTDPEALDVLMRATVARFRFMEDSGDDGSGVQSMYDSASVLSVSLSRRAQGATAAVDPLVLKLGVRAAQILRSGGMISGVVYEA